MNRVVVVILVLLAGLAAYVFIAAPILRNSDTDPAAATRSTWVDTSAPSARGEQPADPAQESATAAPAPPTASGSFPQEDQLFVGVFTEAGPHNLADTEAFIEATGVQPAVHEFSAGWAHGAFDRRLFDAVAERGMMPMLAWEPWDYQAPPPRQEQSDYQLADIIEGHHDAYLRSWARGIADLEYPVAIRFAHEMNGTWYPWSERVNGNQPGEYVEAYRHVHDIVTEAGADNVTWVWSPNVNFTGSSPFEAYYPGGEYVDWLGIVGYYGVGAESFDKIFGNSIEALQNIDDKPVVITEVGAPDLDGRAQEWVSDMFASLPDYPAVIGFVWFEVDSGADWRLAENPAAARAFGDAAGGRRYSAIWGSGVEPLTRAP